MKNVRVCIDGNVFGILEHSLTTLPWPAASEEERTLIHWRDSFLQGRSLRLEPIGHLSFVVQLHVGPILNCFLRLRPVPAEALSPSTHSIWVSLVWVLSALGVVKLSVVRPRWFKQMGSHQLRASKSACSGEMPIEVGLELCFFDNLLRWATYPTRQQQHTRTKTGRNSEFRKL